MQGEVMDIFVSRKGVKEVKKCKKNIWTIKEAKILVKVLKKIKKKANKEEYKQISEYKTEENTKN